MRRKEWSLAVRLNRLFVGTSITLMGLYLVGAVFSYREVMGQLDALAAEEPHEAKLAAQSPPTLDSFAATVDAFQQLHHTTPMAWRVWKRDTGEVWGEFGRRELLTPAMPALVPLRETVVADRGLRWRTDDLSSELVVGVVIDGSSEIASLLRYGTLAGLVVVAAITLSILLGRWIVRRVTRTLAEVADSVRTSHRPGTVVLVENHRPPTEIREVVEALAEMSERIEAEMQRVRVFTAGLAHELRSPIQNLLGETEIALLSERAAHDYRATLAKNLEELRELGDAVDNLVSICAARNGASDHASEQFDLEHEARLRLAREEARAARKNVSVALSAEGDLTMRGDREAVLRAVRNLVANAVDWCDPGGTVEVALRRTDDRISIVVDDDGPGVPEELRGSIFEAFTRGPTQPGRRAGYGLGLALARRAAEEHRGTIGVSVSPAGGARFTLEMAATPSGAPRERATPPDPEPVAPEASDALEPPYTALVLKEDPTSRVERIATRAGPVLRKTYRPRPFLLWRTFLARSKGAREHRNLALLCAAGIDCVRPVGCGETRVLGLVTQSWVATEYLEGARDLKALFATLRPIDATRAPLRRTLLQRYGELLRALHRAGFCSNTLQPRNVLSTGPDPTARLVICDQPALIAFPRSVHASWIGNIDLFDVAYSPQRQRDFAAAERYRLTLAYCAGDRAEARRLWRKLSARSEWRHRAIKAGVSAVFGHLLPARRAQEARP